MIKTNLLELSSRQLFKLIFAGLCGSVGMIALSCLYLPWPPHPSILIGSFAIGFTIGMSYLKDEIAQLWLLGGTIGGVGCCSAAILAEFGIWGVFVVLLQGMIGGAALPYLSRSPG